MSHQSGPGWYGDPTGRHEQRYWNGTAWTDHVFSRGLQSEDSLASPSPSVKQPPTGQASVPPGWLADPLGRYELRYWDGNSWTDHVLPIGGPGSTSVDRAENRPASSRPTTRHDARVVRQVTSAGVVRGTTGGGTLMTESVLVVNQEAKLIGSTLSYSVFDQNGHRLGAFQELRRDLGTRLGDRARGRTERNRTFRFQVTDAGGQVLLTLTRPEQWFTSKSTMVVGGPDGLPIGGIVQESVGLGGAALGALHAGITTAPAIAQLGLGGLRGAAASASVAGLSQRASAATRGLKKVGHARFGLEAQGQRHGSIHARSSSAWDFDIRDHNGAEIGVITKTWAGWRKERFTKADNYVVQMQPSLGQPLRCLVVAAALAIDVAMKQGTPTQGSARRRRYR